MQVKLILKILVFCYAKYYMYISAYLIFYIHAEQLHHIFKLFFPVDRRVELGNVMVCVGS